MKVLNGAELAGFIKERQAKQVRALRQAHKVFPKLAIVQTVDDPVIDAYVRMKQRYGDDILVAVDHHRVHQSEAAGRIIRLNADPSVHGVIVQLPMAEPSQTDELVNLIAPDKDIDGLGNSATWDAATPMAISWLLAGYGVDLAHRRLTIIGQGRLVGAPLAEMWRRSGYAVTTADETTEDLAELTRSSDVIVTATGQPGLLTSDMVSPDTTVVDAGTASENGVIKGDVAADVRERHDITITPEKGGVGPLTIAALFDNLIRAARKTVAT